MKEFVDYQIALDLKELGFDEPCFTTYDNEGRLRNPFDYPKSEYADSVPYIEDTEEWIYNSSLNNPENFNAISNPTLLKFYLDNPFTAAPLWQQAWNFFREKYKLENSVYWANVYCDYRFSINNLNNPKKEGELDCLESGTFKTYEEARLACLEKLIELCKEKKS